MHAHNNNAASPDREASFKVKIAPKLLVARLILTHHVRVGGVRCALLHTLVVAGPSELNLTEPGLEHCITRGTKVAPEHIVLLLYELGRFLRIWRDRRDAVPYRCVELLNVIEKTRCFTAGRSRRRPRWRPIPRWPSAAGGRRRMPAAFGCRRCHIASRITCSCVFALHGVVCVERTRAKHRNTTGSSSLAAHRFRAGRSKPFRTGSFGRGWPAQRPQGRRTVIRHPALLSMQRGSHGRRASGTAQHQ